MIEIKNIYGVTPTSVKEMEINFKELKKHSVDMKRNPIENCYFLVEKSGESKFWIGLYDSGKVDIEFVTHGGIFEYTFDEFFDKKDISSISDFKIQNKALAVINRLIYSGVLVNG